MKKKMKKTDFKTHFFAPVRGQPIFSVDSRFLGPRNRQKLGKKSENLGPLFSGDFLKKNRGMKNIAIFRISADLSAMLATLVCTQFWENGKDELIILLLNLA